VAPCADRCQFPTDEKRVYQRQHAPSTEIMGPEGKAERTWHFAMLRQPFVARSHEVDADVPDVTISGLS